MQAEERAWAGQTRGDAVSTLFTGTSALVHPCLGCSCLACARLSPASQLLRLSIIVVEEIGMIYEEDVFMKVTWQAGRQRRQEQWGLNNYKL